MTENEHIYEISRNMFRWENDGVPFFLWFTNWRRTTVLRPNPSVRMRKTDVTSNPAIATRRSKIMLPAGTAIQSPTPTMIVQVMFPIANEVSSVANDIKI
eukprot:08705_3